MSMCYNVVSHGCCMGVGGDGMHHIGQSVIGHVRGYESREHSSGNRVSDFSLSKQL